MQDKVKIFKIITVATIVFIVFLASAIILNLIKLGIANNRQDQLKAQLAMLTTQYQSNAEEIDYKQTEDYITRYAREELGYIGEGETAFTGK